jgi:hypothetical protein
LSPLAAFGLSFGLTLVLLGCVVATGKRRIIKRHIAFVLLTLGSLAWTIHEALELGHVYDLKSAGIITPIHLTLAKVTTAAFLTPLLTGLRTLFVPKTRALHKKLAYTVLALTVVCAVTGVMMIAMSKPL